ncbi:non-homologous end-joining DNA ligase [Nocardia transvalensis]|uniref:non-homologous end-joining DNA ligase n=1 Tax=Nocardia transvalensis TaxID=37333 RepID=UPI001894801B|nr:non-homologous end-joining DNA ligase [Nocardia transvalensis]MBF6333505.1 non-homologous end-joining DNA ligase [Nocardia transvalensis]
MTELPRYAPMLAQASTLPTDDSAWNFEVKFDGIRAVGYVDRDLRLVSRNNKDITVAWPELADLAPADPPFVVDGEIVVFSAYGRPSFEALQPRMHQRNPAAVRALARSSPATYMIFDLLQVGNRPLIDLPYRQRRHLLEQLGLRGSHWQVPPRLPDTGAEALAESRRLHLEGIIAKRTDGPYLPGRRSPLWTKIKNFRTQEVVVVGWRPGTGRRAGHIGSLLMAIHDDTGRLVYIGNVGTGFSRSVLDDLQARLQPLQRKTAPVEANVPDAIWVAPKIVGEVSYTEWTGDGKLRHPSWRGLRPDKDSSNVTRERQ